MNFLKWSIGGNTAQAWLIALAVTIVSYILLRSLKAILIRRFFTLAGREEEGGFRDFAGRILKETNFLVLVILALYLGSLQLSLSDLVRKWTGTAALIALMAQLAIWGNTLISFWFARYKKQYFEIDAARVSSVGAITFVARVALFSVIVLLALDNIPGVEVTALLASLGIGGIAVALAVQNILADLFASLSISLDKPFVIGDFIIVDNYLGVVEHVGLKTTRIRSLSGEQLVFSNNDLLNSRIRNYKRMIERRVAFTIGVTYQTSYEDLQKIPPMIKEIIQAQPHTRFDRAHFKAYGPYSLDFEIVYYIAGADYNLYMDIQQAINLEIYRRFEESGIEFAYPTQTIHVSDASIQALVQRLAPSPADIHRERRV